MGIILAYDVWDEESFHNIRNWMTQIDSHANEKVEKMIIANKWDSTERVISTE